MGLRHRPSGGLKGPNRRGRGSETDRSTGRDLPGGVLRHSPVAMGPRGAAYALKVRLIVTLPGIEATTAHRLAQAAKGVCPYSIATKGNIPFALEIAS
ncbi:hypothetical protein EV650_1522 [Kribbella kalugense]|uniref:OsmC-like protein n=2 Tax=Kribbella kalugense TaxID=2512221 RepID=A0A4V3G8F1_9ACTN|nr:hypothetical protein EV650_1522 [Kribbella kalugense]